MLYSAKYLIILYYTMRCDALCDILFNCDGLMVAILLIAVSVLPS
jgi:hypothetical protein